MMTSREARQLLVGTVVMWQGNPEDAGTIRKLGPSGFFVDWQNGQRGWIDYRDAGNINLWQPAREAI